MNTTSGSTSSGAKARFTRAAPRRRGRRFLAGPPDLLDPRLLEGVYHLDLLRQVVGLDLVIGAVERLHLRLDLRRQRPRVNRAEERLGEDALGLLGVQPIERQFGEAGRGRVSHERDVEGEGRRAL